MSGMIALAAAGCSLVWYANQIRNREANRSRAAIPKHLRGRR
jgi:hypothetical protein